MNRDKCGLWTVVVCALGVTVGAPGCGTSPEENPAELIAPICDQMCACKGGCSASEKTDCVNSGQAQHTEADALGCTDEWGDFATCLYDHPACDNGNPIPGQCGSKMVVYGKCIDAATPPCKALRNDVISAFEVCGVTAPATPDTCTAADEALLQCESDCLNAAPDCAAVAGTDAAAKKSLDDCLAACSP